MILRTTEVYKLTVVTDDPRFEGFALSPAPSILGRESLDDDLTPGFADAELNPQWKQPSLAQRWQPPSAIGRVAELSDYPGVDMVLPAFSARAVNALRDLLEPNGELLPLATKTTTNYFIFNILTISDALELSKSRCEFWCDPPTTATSIEYFAFDSQKLKGLSIFRIREYSIGVFVTNVFVDRVAYAGLNGFSFTRVWPLPCNVNWRLQTDNDRENRRALKRHTLVLVLPYTSTSAEDRRIREFEDTIDVTLYPESVTDEYVGSYEGHEKVTNEYRMFLSCPDADRLFEHIRNHIETLNWRSRIQVYLRYGEMYDKEAFEKLHVI